MELACILERKGSRAQERYPDVRVARTLDELLADRQIQLCVIATPNGSHFELAQACLLAGRDVVVDKPFAPTLAEAEELVRLAANCGRLITVFQDRRWDGDFRTVKKIVHSARLGKIAEYECRYDRFRPEPKPNAWREKAEQPAAGVLFDLGPHVIDQALVGSVHALEFGGEDGLDVFYGLEDALAEVVLFVSVAKFNGLVLAGGGSAGNGGAPFGSAVEDDVGLNGGVSAGVEDFACVDRDDLGHVAPVR